MLLPGENSPKSWLFVMVLVSTIVAFSESSEGKKHSHEYNPRASDGESSNDESASEKKIAKPSSEEQTRPKKEESSKEHEKPDKSDDDGDEEDKISASGEDNNLRITRGPKAGNFEPEEDNPKIHSKYAKSFETDNLRQDDDRRYKRHIY